MSIRRHAARRDANEGAIVDALEDIGIVVHRLSEPGLPDLLTFNPRATTTQPAWLPMEVKMPGGTLTLLQSVSRAKSPWPVVESVRDALALFGVRA